MSIPRQTIYAICRDQDRRAAHSLCEEMFSANEDDLRLFQWFTAYIGRYNVVPSTDALQAHGARILPVNRPVADLLDQLRSQLIHNTIRSRYEELNTVMQGMDMAAAAAIIEDLHTRLQRQNVIGTAESLADLAEEALLTGLQERMSPGNTGITLGFPVLDELTHRAQPGDVITVAARPALGKSWLLIKMALAAWAAGHPVLFCSMEMGNIQIARRALSYMAQIHPNAIRMGRLDEWGENALRHQVQLIREGVPFSFMTGDFKRSIQDVRAMHALLRPALVVIDASYLLKRKGQSKRWEMLTDVMEDIKELATATGTPVIQSVQFNREGAKDKSGGDLGTIGGTDAIGQISSIVIKLAMGRPPNEASERVIEVIKNREGAVGKFAVTYGFEPSVRMDYIPPSHGGIPVDEGGLVTDLMNTEPDAVVEPDEEIPDEW